MTPLLPKGDRPWQIDPGHIHDVPEPPPMPDAPDQAGSSASRPGPAEKVGTELPAHEVEVVHVTEEAREPDREPEPVPEPSEVKVPRALAQEIRRAMKRYPQSRSAAIPALWAVQRRYGWCTPEGIREAAAVMGVTPAHLQSVASFYDLFHLEPQGEHQVLVCTNISCWLRGADDVLGEFVEAAGAEGPGHSSPDGTMFVRGFECLGACDIAPMASIDERFYGPLTEGDAAEIAAQLRSGNEVLPGKRLEDRDAAGGKRGPADKRLTRHPLNKPKRPRPKRARRR
ncbi:MAG: NAD(P)H-dependent oxidoreductase subunit E [Solirubrobacterales bacterium]